eukprot:TRINITY_DN5217_c1_g1_i3.p1 TRINITY_DN5217_c1_g1~~TRINITY_DN5217_c1_g1_i3.p1  ORF type:complete len:653 (+),score=336.08 TRINITY_DN5217_c1_g1_i3:150-2108(+)
MPAAKTVQGAQLRSLNPRWNHVNMDAKTNQIVFGREPDCSVSFPQDKLISSKHCKIFRDSNIYFVEDLSSNGTFINGDKVGKGNRRVIHDGDELSLVIKSSELAKKHAKMQDAFIAYIFKENTNNQDMIYKHYDLKNELGSGSFAVVKKAVDKRSGREVAVKIVDKKKFTLNPAFRKEQLSDEVKVMRAITHPHILQIIDVYDSEDFLYLVLELASGGDLFEMIAGKTHYSEKESKVLFGQLASAVGYLHDQGIAHRDLKPENILMSNENHIKLTDFGFSKIFGETQVMKTLCGTPQYLAPEILFALEEKVEGYSHAVDIWSMGVILYIMMAGYMPFSEDGFDDIKEGNYSLDDAIFDEISDEGKDMLKKLLTVKVEDRITIEGIFKHPWMKSIKRIAGTKPKVSDSKGIISQEDAEINEKKGNNKRKQEPINSNSNNVEESGEKKRKTRRDTKEEENVDPVIEKVKEEQKKASPISQRRTTRSSPSPTAPSPPIAQVEDVQYMDSGRNKYSRRAKEAAKEKSELKKIEQEVQDEVIENQESEEEEEQTEVASLRTKYRRTNSNGNSTSSNNAVKVEGKASPPVKKEKAAASSSASPRRTTRSSAKKEEVEEENQEEEEEEEEKEEEEEEEEEKEEEETTRRSYSSRRKAAK